MKILRAFLFVFDFHLRAVLMSRGGKGGKTCVACRLFVYFPRPLMKTENQKSVVQM